MSFELMRLQRYKRIGCTLEGYFHKGLNKVQSTFQLVTTENQTLWKRQQVDVTFFLFSVMYIKSNSIKSIKNCNVLQSEYDTACMNQGMLRYSITNMQQPCLNIWTNMLFTGGNTASTEVFSKYKSVINSEFGILLLNCMRKGFLTAFLFLNSLPFPCAAKNNLTSYNGQHYAHGKHVWSHIHTPKFMSLLGFISP